MMDYRKSLGVAVMAISLIGAGCAGSAPSVATPTSNVPAAIPAPVAEVPKVPVKFSEVKSDLFGLSGKYSALTISNGTGTCLTKLPYTELSFSPSAPGSNFMLRDKGVTIDEKKSSSTPGSMMFDGKTTDGNDLRCIMRVPFAGESATLSCADANEKEVCNATYTALMLKPL
jgi:hypothetical protein